MLWEPATYSPDFAVTTQVYHVTSSDGFGLDYTCVLDTRGTDDLADDWMQYSGIGSCRWSFPELHCDRDGWTAEVESSQSDGSTYSMSVPLDSTLPITDWLPDFTKVTYGAYTDPMTAMEFTLTSTPKLPCGGRRS